MDKTFLLNRILKSDGVNQGQRLGLGLDPDFIKIDNQDIKDLINFVYSLSKEINFFNLLNEADGDWHKFFNYFIDTTTDSVVLSETQINSLLKAKSDFDPHYAIFLTFLKLFQLAQKDLNAVTGRRLDFFYKDVLRLDKKPAAADKVHLILEPNKNITSHKVSAGTQFKAKDIDGKPALYQSDHEIVINKAQVKSIKSIYIDTENDFTIYSSDASNSVDGKGKPSKSQDFKWSAFGESQKIKAADERNMQEVTIGFAIASPMLFLKEGNRVLTITIQFKDKGDAELISGDITNRIYILLSGEKEWISPSTYSVSFFANTLQMVIVATLGSTDKAVVAYDKAVLLDSFDTKLPVIKLILSSGARIYEELYDLEIVSANIHVAVDGVKDLILHNDQSRLDPAKPFQPFGTTPAIDSAFYIGSAEIFQKKLSALSMDILWNDIPDANLGSYYSAYADVSTPLSNLIFTAGLSFLYRDKWLKVNGNYFLFHPAIASQSNHLQITATDWNAALSAEVYLRNPGLQELSGFDHRTHDGFIRIELSGPVTPFKAFGHQEFPNLYANIAIKKATDPGFTGSLPNPPYTPTIKTLSLNYASSQQISLSTDGGYDQFFHIEPFGCAQLDLEKPYLLPQYRNEANLPQPRENSHLYLGNCYLGIENLNPPQNLSILFQVAEGSADLDTIIEEDDIKWSYLSGNSWVPISKLEIIIDTTRGLQTSGIISFSIGEDATSENTLLPSGLYWLRGSVEKNPAGVSQLINLSTQVIQASYVFQNSEDADTSIHFDQSLPPDSIKELVIKDAAIKSVSQPYNSFDGKAKEKDNNYYTRISERLKHKKRALTLWDYERLVLEEFHSIFKVKCLTHTDAYSDLSPGAVMIVVVPSLINKNSVNPLQPKASLVTLLAISDYISQYIPEFVHCEVTNPIYEQLLVDFKVGFMPGKDPGYYGNLLNDEIKKFLSPWAYEEGQDITFGGKVYKSDILFFIENRDYVDFVNDFKLYHIFDGVDEEGNGIGDMAIEIDFIIRELFPPGIGDMAIDVNFIVGRDVEVAMASGPRSILVSASNHRISVLKTGEYKCSGIEFGGIDFMSVGVDFIVGSYPFAIGSMKIVNLLKTGVSDFKVAKVPDDLMNQPI